NIGLEFHGVARGQQGIEQFVHGNRLVVLQARAKILALQHARQPVMGAKPNDVFGVHFAEPFAVVANLGFVAIENLEYLVEVSPRVGVHLVAGQRWSCLRNAGRIANHRTWAIPSWAIASTRSGAAGASRPPSAAPPSASRRSLRRSCCTRRRSPSTIP